MPNTLGSVFRGRVLRGSAALPSLFSKVTKPLRPLSPHKASAHKKQMFCCLQMLKPKQMFRQTNIFFYIEDVVSSMKPHWADGVFLHPLLGRPLAAFALGKFFFKNSADSEG